MAIKSTARWPKYNIIKSLLNFCSVIEIHFLLKSVIFSRRDGSGGRAPYHSQIRPRTRVWSLIPGPAQVVLYCLPEPPAGLNLPPSTIDPHRVIGKKKKKKKNVILLWIKCTGKIHILDILGFWLWKGYSC